MYTSYIDSGSYLFNDNCTKPMSPSTQTTSRNHGTHMNPSKMKSSFIRQSFNFQNNNAESYKTGQKNIQPENLQQILNKKREMRTSQTFQNPLQKIRKSQRRNGEDNFVREFVKRSPSKQLANQHRYSNMSRSNSCVQSIFIDSKSVQDSMTLILKRVAKNQYQIQKLKKQIVIQNVKQVSISKQTEFQRLKEQVKSLIHQNMNSQFTKQNIQSMIQSEVDQLKQQMKQFQKATKFQISDFYCQLKRQIDQLKNEVLTPQTHTQQIRFLQEKFSANFQSLKNYNQNMQKKLVFQSQNSLVSQIQKLKHFFNAKNIQIVNKIQKLQQNQREKPSIILRKSKKICNDAIQIAYLQTINTKTIHNNLFSDRSKLLANVFNKQTELNNYQKQIEDSKYNKKQKYPLLRQEEKSLSIVSNQQETYYIDHQGYLLDKDFYYLTDENDHQIKIQEEVIQMLRKNGVIV